LRRATPKDGNAPKEIDIKTLERGQLRMDPERHTCTWDGQAVTLTVTEFLILQSLAQRPGIVKSRDALMDAAYDDQVYVDDRTIDSHIKRLRKKFKVVDDSFAAIETLYGVGYRFKEAEASARRTLEPCCIGLAEGLTGRHGGCRNARSDRSRRLCRVGRCRAPRAELLAA